MAQTLKLSNFSENNIVDTTQLTAAVAAAVSTLPVANANDFTSGFLLVDIKGSKTAELLPNTSVSSGQSVVLTSPTVLPHDQYSPVYSLFGDSLKIYRAANVDGSQPADTAFTLLATVTIDPNDDATTYLDSSGGGGYWYKYTFYNSVSHAETSIADAVGVRGSFTVNYCSLDEIRQEAGFVYSPYVTDAQIDQKRQAAQDEINGALQQLYVVPLQPPINDYIKRSTIRLAAGYLRLAQYSAISDPNINGQNMVNDAQDQLTKIIMKERDLTTKDGTSMAGVSAGSTAEGWPDATTPYVGSSSGGAPRVFRMGDIQGQPTSANPNGLPTGNLYYGRRW